MKKCKHIRSLLFDLDGTLVDTSEDITYALNIACAEEGLPPLGREDCLTFVGRGLANTLAAALAFHHASVSDGRFSFLVDVFERTYGEHPCDSSTPYPGIDKLLEQAVTYGLSVGVLSNKKEPLVQTIVKTLFPHIPFALVRGANSTFKLKPDPASSLDFAKRIGCDPSEVLYVGDSEIDVRTARAAGMPHVTVTWGFCRKSDLIAFRCLPLCDTVDQLADAIREYRYGIQFQGAGG